MGPGLRLSPTDSDLPRVPFEDPVGPSGPPPGPNRDVFGWIQWAFAGNSGLRAGWSVLMFYLLYRLFSLALGSIALAFYPRLANFQFSASLTITGELTGLISVFGAIAIVARLENRSVYDYYLRDQLRTRRFLTGLLAGFITLSTLVATLCAGGWMRLSTTNMTGGQIVAYAMLWAIAFLLTSFLEEGAFRGFLLFTLARGINFWWAFAIVSAVCMRLLMSAPGSNSWGVYLMALLGLVPCMILHHLKTKNAGFWQAAWVTSTLFGYWHTSNHGENSIGIFTAAAIGLVFCGRVRLTGSAWWAIGCHAAWDWAETYFYGTPDSGLVARGHLFSAQPQGSTIMSGGSVGPEGSIAALIVIQILLAVILVVYRRRPALSAAP